MLFGRSLIHPLNLILIINIFIFILQKFQSYFFTVQFALIPELLVMGKYWQIFTYGFLHDSTGFPLHILVNMYAFYILGIEIIEKIGKIKFVTLYFLSQFSGGVFVLFFALANYFFIVPTAESNLSLLQIPTIGSSGAVFGLLSVFGLLYPNQSIFLLFFPVQAKNAVWVALLIGYVLELAFSVPLSNSCHLGGALMGRAFYYLFLMKKNKSKSKIKLLKDKDIQKISEIPILFEDMVKKQKGFNLNILNELSQKPIIDEKVKYLKDLQINNANICSKESYYPNDQFCIKCEWLVNCEMRQIKEIKKSRL